MDPSTLVDVFEDVAHRAGWLVVGSQPDKAVAPHSVDFCEVEPVDADNDHVVMIDAAVLKFPGDQVVATPVRSLELLHEVIEGELALFGGPGRWSSVERERDHECRSRTLAEFGGGPTCHRLSHECRLPGAHLL